LRETKKIEKEEKKKGGGSRAKKERQPRKRDFVSRTRAPLKKEEGENDGEKRRAAGATRGDKCRKRVGFHPVLRSSQRNLLRGGKKGSFKSEKKVMGAILDKK